MGKNSTIGTLWLFLSLGLAACGELHSNATNAPTIYPPVVAIFHQPPNAKPYRPKPNGPWIPSRWYKYHYRRDDGMGWQGGFPKDTEVDTALIEGQRPWVEIIHKVHVVDEWSFWVKAGDTVHFRYDGERPIAEISNRPIRPYDLNYEWQMRQAVVQDSFTAEVVRRGGIMAFEYFEQHPELTQENKYAAFDAYIVEKVRKELLAENHFLDSIYQADLIDSALYARRKLSLRYDSLSNVCFREGADAHPGEMLLDYESETFLLRSFRLAMKNYLYRSIHIAAPKYKVKNGVEVDYAFVFDSVVNASLLSPEVRDDMLAMTLEQLIEYGSVEQGQEYLAKFRAITRDTQVVRLITERFKLNQPVTSTLYLEDLAGTVDSLQSVIAATQGKVLYVDFWASWCAPCLRAMPDAAKLRERLAGEEVAFAYISLDENPDDWAKASQRLGFDSLAYNYRITNRRTSLFLEDMDISSIPRYLIYDQAGNMVYPQAPGPDDERIEEILRALAQQE